MLLALAFAAFATILRPSNAVIWIVLGFYSLILAKSLAERRTITLQAIAIGSVTKALVLGEQGC